MRREAIGTLDWITLVFTSPPVSKRQNLRPDAYSCATSFKTMDFSDSEGPLNPQKRTLAQDSASFTLAQEETLGERLAWGEFRTLAFSYYLK